MNRAELQTMSVERVLDAQALLAAGRWEFAYYSVGYSVECALKSCLLVRMVETAWVFKERWKSQDCLTHKFGELIILANLEKELGAAQAASAQFKINWGIADLWTVSSRYEPKTEVQARELFAAITEVPYGVLQWIQRYW